MLEMHLRQLRFTYSACGPFIKSKEKIQKFKETGDSRYIYQKKVDKSCFQHDMTYGDFKDSPRRTAFDKVLRDKAFNIAKNTKYDGYKRDRASIVCNFFDKNTFNTNKGTGIDSDAVSESKRPSVLHSSFIDNIWGADPADMQLIGKFNEGFRFLLCVIDIYRKYAWPIPLKDKTGIKITNAFQQISIL